MRFGSRETPSTHQVISLRRIGQVAQADDPGSSSRLSADQRMETALPDAANRASALSIWWLNSSRARPYQSPRDREASRWRTHAVRQNTSELRASVGSRSTRMFHARARVILLGRGLSPACPQQSLVRENGPSRWTRSKPAWPAQNCQIRTTWCPAPGFDLSRIREQRDHGGQLPGLVSCSIAS